MPAAAEAIAAALRAHPAVRACLVLPAAAGPLVYVVPQPHYPHWLPAARESMPATQVAQWQARYAATYAAPAGDARFDTAGWIDRASGAPLAEAAMREWVAGTVARVRGLRPARVLEIGCGTGLLLWRIAPACREYWATDLEPAVVARLARAVDATRPPLPGVRLLARPADALDDLPAGHFDLVILNSVVQYFPDVAYLTRVLAGAARLLAPGGRVFVGDVRSRPLAPLFHATLALAQAPDATPSGELQERIAARVAGEQELLLDPALFLALAGAHPAFRGARLELKRGHRATEMLRFRYDVVLPTGRPDPSVPGRAWCTWDHAGGSVAAVAQRLGAERPAALGLADIPNARLAEAATVQALLSDPAGPATAGALRATLTAQPRPPAIDPEAFWALGRREPYDVTVRPAASGRATCYDVLFVHKEQRMPFAPPGGADAILWGAYANTPRTGDEPRALVAALRAFLAARVPASPPGTLVVLEAFPRGPDGRIDLTMLPPIRSSS